MSNNRIYYAVQALGIKTEGVDTAGGAYVTVRGLQSVATTTNFNLRAIFQMGQLSIYENVEELPDIEITANKLLDGNPLIYTLATKAALAPTLSGRSNDRSLFALGIFDDTADFANGTPGSQVAMSGMFISSLNYNFPLEEDFSEEVTAVGNNKVWKDDSRMVVTEPVWASTIFTGIFDGTETPTSSGGTQQRQDMIFTFSASTLDQNLRVADADTTILPIEIPGVTASGTHDLTDATRARLQSITVSADLGRESINELGKRGPYHRFVTFPIEVTTEISVTSTSGDRISALEDGILNAVSTCTDSANIGNNTIRVATCEGTRLYMGLKNKLSSINYSGGDTGGGNVTVSYTYTNNNDLTVMHSGDPGAIAWASRTTHLIN